MQYRKGVRKDLTGKKFSKLTVLNYSHSNPENSMAYYRCLCDCGKEKVIAHGSLQTGNTKSCGCESHKTGVESTMYKHGKSKTRTYAIWSRIKNRCFSPNSPDYKDYGAQDIVMSEEFKNNFDAFYAEMGDPPSINHSIDRVCNNMGYISGNMRWATAYQQARNKSLQRNNKTGKSGVHIYEMKYATKGGVKKTTYVVATWATLDGKCKNKKFNCKKLGLLEAFCQAITYRDLQIKMLNEDGAGYSPIHGKQKKGVK